jgi:dihydropteroate synthase
MTIGGPAPVRLMGVINCSPESFFTASYVPPGEVLRRAEALLAEGADFIDIGPRPTAPGAPPVSVAEEAARIEAALRELDGCGMPLSVDTMHRAVLEIALRHEVDALNDIGGLADAALARCAADAGIPVFAMASVREPGDSPGVEATLAALALVLERCERFGIAGVILDPAIGRWTPARTAEHDWELCRHFSTFIGLGSPVLAAVSRKSFIGVLLGALPEDRLIGSLAVTASLVAQGAAVVRTHDVAATRDVVAVCEHLRRC